jgi:peptidoglycan-N-acetylglucosamine deacetylase
MRLLQIFSNTSVKRRTVAFVAASIFMSLPASGQQKIAFTWDDLPAHSSLPPGKTRQQVIDELIATIKQNHMPAPYGFVNAKLLEGQPELIKVLDAWRAAGFPLGNHTWSHLNLNAPSTTLEAWEGEVLQNEPVLRKEMGQEDFHWLRYPNLAEGTTPEKRMGARKFLAEHGYRIAGVTMSFSDYAYNEPYARCMASGDEAAVKQLEDSYLQEAARNLEYAHAMSTALYGRDIPYVLLMHIGALDAKLLPRLLELYRQHGVQFISLQEAEQDPFYRNDLDLTLDPSPDTLEAAMRLKGLPMPAHEPVAVNLMSVCRQPPVPLKP